MIEAQTSVRSIFQFAIALLSIGAAVGCSSAGLGLVEATEDAAPLEAAQAERLQQLLTDIAAREGVATHRVLLSIGRREIDLNSRLAISPEQGLRLVAMVSMGQVMMDVLVQKNGEVVLMREPLGMRPKWIENFVARDLAMLYSSASAADYRFARLSTGEAVAYRAVEEGLTLRHRFDLDSGRWLGAEVVRGRRRVWIAENRSAAGTEDSKGAVGEEWYVAAPRYELRIRTTDFNPGPPDSKLFALTEGEDDS